MPFFLFQGAGGIIPGGATLYFQVEMLGYAGWMAAAGPAEY